MKRPWKPHYPKHRGPIEPDRTILLEGEARVLLTTWEVNRDKAVIDRRLAALDKIYWPGAEQAVRQLMHKVNRDERCG